jgi:hypothetical protein
MKNFLKIILILLVIFVLKIKEVYSIENVAIFVGKTSNAIKVKARIIPAKKFIEEFRAGLGKNVEILIELYRRWSIIPDEFITGVKIQRSFISDPIKEEYIIKNLEGTILKEKRFKSSADALDWGLKVDSVEFHNTNNFESGEYYIKVTVESNIKKLPLLLEHFLFFIPKYETKIVKESERFILP